jgi:cytochrome P450
LLEPRSKHGQVAATPQPSKIIPPDEQLPPLRLIRTVVRNPIEAWPKPVYEQPLYRSRFMGRETVFVMEPDLVRQVLVDQADAFIKAETLRRALQPVLGDAILTAGDARWRWQRQAAAPIFRPDQIRTFVPAMIAAAERRRELWLSRVGQGVNVAQEMLNTTFDIIAETMLSGRGGIDVDKVEKGATDYSDSISWVILLTLLRAPRWMPYPGRGRVERARDYLREEVERMVAERRRSDQERNGLVTRLLAATDPETGRSMSDRDVVDNLLTFLVAGHETTALALTWTFYLLSLDPEIAERVVQEIEAVTQGGSLRQEHIEALLYTRQVVQEAMRLYPPAPVVVRAAVRDVHLGNELIRAGSPTYIPVYAVHRHRLLWDEPDTFDPDRFAPEVVKARHHYAYLPFGAGLRICTGMSFALLEAVVILATLLKSIRPSLRPGYVPELKQRITLRPAAGMPMRLERRTHTSMTDTAN